MKKDLSPSCSFIQRSHRFPAQLHRKIKAIADSNNVPFSRVVNALLLEGLEAVNFAIVKQKK